VLTVCARPRSGALAASAARFDRDNDMARPVIPALSWLLAGFFAERAMRGTSRRFHATPPAVSDGTEVYRGREAGTET
jgi:hypothetical protein